MEKQINQGIKNPACMKYCLGMIVDKKIEIKKFICDKVIIMKLNSIG